jgi:hypothetical protein
MIELPIAHAGHWLEGLLYLLPIVVVVLALALQGRRQDRRG